MLLSNFRSQDAKSLRLINRRVFLRAPQPGDWRDWADVRAQSRDFLTPWEPTWSYDALTRGAFRRRLRQYGSEWRQGVGYSFFVFRGEDSALMGGITISNLRRGVAQCASLGYWIGRRYARQGYMSEALVAVLDYSFEQLGLHRLEAACLPSNAASQGLLQKVGFSEEGYAREYLRINAQWQDHRLFAVLRDDKRPQSAAAEGWVS